MKQVLFLVLLIAIMCSASAQMGKNVVIDKPVYEDVYIAGGEVMVNAPVYGDLVVTGGTVTINDTVSSDILAAGGTITFKLVVSLKRSRFHSCNFQAPLLIAWLPVVYW